MQTNNSRIKVGAFEVYGGLAVDGTGTRQVLPGLSSIAGLSAARLSATINGTNVGASGIADVMYEDTSVLNTYRVWFAFYDGTLTKAVQLKFVEESDSGQPVVAVYGLSQKYTSGDVRANAAYFETPANGTVVGNGGFYQVAEIRLKPAASTDQLGADPAGLVGWLDYSIDSGAWVSTYTAPTSQGSHTVQIRQTDYAGNVRFGSVLSFTLDSTAPTVTAPASFSLTEDVAGNLLFSNTAFSDAAASLTVTLSVTEGAVSATGNANVTVGGSALSRTFTGSPAALNTFFSTAGAITYLGAAHASGNKTLTVTVADTAGNTSSASSTLALAAVNDAPVLSGGSSVTVTAQNNSQVVHSALSLADVDNTSFASATVSITTGFVAAEDALALPASASIGNISASYNASTGMLTLSSSGSTANLAQWQEALRLVRYINNAGSSASGTARTVSFQINDGQAQSNLSNVLASTLSLDVTGPVVDLNGASAGLDFGATTVTSSNASTGVSLVSGATLTEANRVSSVRVAVSGLLNGASEKLVVGSTALNADGSSLPATVSDGSATWTLAFSSGVFSFSKAGNASASEAQALLAALSYRNTAGALTDGLRQFTVSAVDEFTQTTATAAISTVAVNAAAPAAASSSPLITADANGDGVKGDQFTLSFSEMVDVSKITLANLALSAGSYGTGASIAAQNAVTIGGTSYARQFVVTAGSGSTYTTGATITLGAANVVDTGGTTATANVVFNMSKITAPAAPVPPSTVATDNYISATERAATSSLSFTHGSAIAGDRLNLYLNGALLKTVNMTAAATSTSVSLSGADWGADGAKALTARVEDSAGNFSGASSPKAVTVDTSLSQGAISMWLSTDAGTLGQANAGDVVSIKFSESVKLSGTGLPAAFGSGATATPVGAVNGLSTQWNITLGSSPNLTGSTGNITFKGVTDVASNGSSDIANASGDLVVAVPSDVLGAPQVRLIGNVADDNVINSAERALSQNITLNLAGALANDVVKLYMDGVEIASNTLDITAQNNQALVMSVAANAWGSDGQRALTATIQRSSGSVGASPVRQVYVAADASHWSAGLGSNGLWFDPDTLSSALGASLTQWTASNRALTLGVDRTQVGGTGVGVGMVMGSSNGHNMLIVPASNGGLWANNTGLTAGSAWASKTIFSAFFSTDLSFTATSKQIFTLATAPANVTNTQITTFMYQTSVGTAYMNTNGLFVSTPANTWAFMSQTFTPSLQTAWLNSQSLGSQAIGSGGLNLSDNTVMVGSRVTSSVIDRPFVGYLGDQIFTEQVLSTAQRQEVDTYIGQKYGAMGESVKVTSQTLINGLNTTAYNLASSVVSSVLLDQVLDRSTTGDVNDTVVTAGSDWVATGAGADTVYVKDLNFRSIDAGQGNDTLVLDSSYTTAGTIVLADFVSNARGVSGVSGDDSRVNAAGYHRLMGVEKIDLSASAAAQTLAVAAADVNQLSDGNTLGVVLGSNDSVTATGFDSATSTWGYHSFNGVVYEQQWSKTSGADTYILYARGGQLPSFTAVSGATNGNDTLTGSSGNDLLQGGQGNDNLSGGLGADLFRFVKGELGTDTLTDFSKAQGDKVDLSGILQGTGFSLASNLANYLQLSTNGSGNAVLKIDPNGGSSFASPAQTIEFSNAGSSGLTGVSLATLFDERVIVA